MASASGLVVGICEISFYLKEEIVSEQIVRRLDPFRRFLEIAAQGNGEILNYTNIAKDVGVDTKTVQSYYQILSLCLGRRG